MADKAWHKFKAAIETTRVGEKASICLLASRGVGIIVMQSQGSGEGSIGDNDFDSPKR